MSKDIIYLDLPKLAQPPISFMALPLLASASISRLASFLPIFSDKILWHRLGFKDKFSAVFFSFSASFTNGGCLAGKSL